MLASHSCATCAPASDWPNTAPGWRHEVDDRAVVVVAEHHEEAGLRGRRRATRSHSTSISVTAALAAIDATLRPMSCGCAVRLGHEEAASQITGGFTSGT